MTIEVSVVTPTYNRRMFIPTLIEIYKAQTFPKEKMEWIIIDDGRDKVTINDIEKIITLCLRHRLRKDPLESIDSGDKVNKVFKEVFEIED